MAEPIEDPLSETGQAIGSALRTGAVAAGELVRMHLLRQAHRDHDEAQEARAQARSVTGRLNAEKPLAGALYRPTRHPAWWDRATTDDVARAWDAASAFADVDPDAKAALEDLDRGLEERPQLRERLLADHPESLAAQSLAPLASGAAEAGVALAIAADLELDAAPDLGLSDEEQEQAWRAIPPEPEPAQEEELAPYATAPDPGLSEEELWSATPSEPELAAEEEAWCPPTGTEPTGEPDRSPAGEQVLHENHAGGTAPAAHADPLAAARASPDYQEGASIAALVGADFPTGTGTPATAGLAPQGSPAHPDALGITPIAARAGTAAEYQEAAGVAALIRADFPAGAGAAAPAARLGALAGTPWEVQVIPLVNLTRPDLVLTRPELHLTQAGLRASGAER
jgi:hypothetical protein